MRNSGIFILRYMWANIYLVYKMNNLHIYLPFFLRYLFGSINYTSLGIYNAKIICLSTMLSEYHIKYSYVLNKKLSKS